MVWFVGPISRLVGWVIPEKELGERPIDEPKYLEKEALGYPETAISALQQESRHLFEHTIFEIVAHAMSMHRTDIFSDKKAKSVIRKSRDDFEADVRELYLTKVKRIYSEIMAFAIHAQSDLPLTEEQHHRVMELKLANRKMVEIIKNANELNRNVSRYLRTPYPVMQAEYDKLRKKIIRVLRVIRGFDEENREQYKASLEGLKTELKQSIQTGNLRIDSFIRENRITPDMASSLFNDHDNLNDMIENLIQSAALIYGGDTGIV
jgi:phosphate:Na+ symporter